MDYDSLGHKNYLEFITEKENLICLETAMKP
jgi:hypothetical protein